MLCVLSQISAQDIKKRIAVLNIDLSEWHSRNRSTASQVLLKDIPIESYNSLTSLPEQLIRTYTDVSNFVVIDRINYHLITEERERQKSEDFINGYTVAQGKSEGIDYMLTSKFLKSDNTINVRLLDVATGVVLCQAIVQISRSRVGDKATSYYAAQILEDLNTCLDIRYPVVRILSSKKDKAKTILIAAGSKHQMKRGRDVELFIDAQIEVNGEFLSRQEVVGNGVVIEVDGMNFSIVELDEGRSEIFNLIQENTKLFCRTMNW